MYVLMVLYVHVYICVYEHVSVLRFLGCLYAAEACIHLGLLQEAANYLNPDEIIDISTSPGSMVTEKMESPVEMHPDCKQF